MLINVREYRRSNKNVQSRETGNKNVQPRETGNIWYTRRRKTKQNREYRRGNKKWGPAPDQLSLNNNHMNRNSIIPIVL